MTILSYEGFISKLIIIINFRTYEKNNKAKTESGIDYKNHYDLTQAMPVAILAKDGLIVSEEQAERILAFMYNIAEITVYQELDANKKIPIICKCDRTL